MYNLTYTFLLYMYTFNLYMYILFINVHCPICLKKMQVATAGNVLTCPKKCNLRPRADRCTIKPIPVCTLVRTNKNEKYIRMYKKSALIYIL